VEKILETRAEFRSKKAGNGGLSLQKVKKARSEGRRGKDQLGKPER